MSAPLAIIPARGGSKRVPRKNVRLLGDKPLIAWSIECARASDPSMPIVVSTDDPAIAEVAERAGVPVPSLRPAELSQDDTSSIDVLVYEIERRRAQGHRVDAVVLLQPTSPFRRASTVREGLARFAAGEGRSVVSVSALSEHRSWCRTVDARGYLQAIDALSPETFQLNGLLYIARAQHVLDARTLYTDETIALEGRDRVEALDIDTPADWAIAEAIVSAGLTGL